MGQGRLFMQRVYIFTVLMSFSQRGTRPGGSETTAIRSSPRLILLDIEILGAGFQSVQFHTS
jgi:hypothetical protein